MNQNLANSKPINHKENILPGPVASQALLKSRISPPNSTPSKDPTKAESLPRYSTFAYQLQAFKKINLPKYDFSSYFLNKKFELPKPATRASSIQTNPHSETFLRVFILKTQHYKGQ